MKLRFVLLSLCLLLSSIMMGQGRIVPSKEKVSLRLMSRWDNDPDPNQTGQYFNDVWGYAADGREYAIFGSLDSTFFFDVTDPSNIKRVSAFAGGFEQCYHRDFKTSGHYAYGVADEGFISTLQIFDLQYLPDSVVKVYDSDEELIRAHNIFIYENTLYAADCRRKVDTLNDEIHRFSMTAFDITNPIEPKYLYDLHAPRAPNGMGGMFGEVHDLHVRNDTGYLSCGRDGLFIYDFTKRTQPRLITYISRYPQSGYNHSSWTSEDGNYIFFADENNGKELKSYDLRNLRNPASSDKTPEFLTTYGLNAAKGSVPHNPFVRDSLLYIAYYHEGLVIYDVSDPEKPELAYHYDTYPQNVHEFNREGFQGCWGVYPFLPSGTILACDMSNGLHVFRFDTTKVYAPEGEIQLLENPVHDVIRLSAGLNEASTLNINIYDMSGHHLYSSRWPMEKGIFTLEIPTPTFHLSQGMYILTVDNGDWRKSFRLVRR